MVFLEIFKWICAFIDMIIYTLIVNTYVLFAAMCEMNIDSIGEKFKDLTGRIEVFLGIIMLFIVAFALLQAIVDPDKGEKATSELVKKIGISIVLLISMQFIFGLFNELQTLVIKNGLIEKIILGNSSSSAVSSQDPQTDWEEHIAVHNYKESTELTGYEKYVANGKFFSYNLFFAFITVPDDLKNSVMGGPGVADKPTKGLGDVVDDINEEGVYYRYPIISGAVGILLGVMFFTYAVDIGVRAFSLMLLQVIAPIPIIGYIAPGGDKMLGTYFKEYMSAFLELFIKIATIYITLYLMQYCIQAILLDMGGSVNEATTSMFPSMGEATVFFRVLLLVTVFVALFYFSKKFPKMLGSLFGLKFESNINPMKAAGKIIGMGTKLGLGAAGLVGGGILATGAAIGTGAGVGGVLKAGLNGAGQGAQNGFKSKNIGDAIKNSFKQNGEIIKKGREFGYNLGDQGGTAGVRAKKANVQNERAIAGARSVLETTNKAKDKIKNMKAALEKEGFKSGSGVMAGYKDRDDYVNRKTVSLEGALEQAKQSYDPKFGVMSQIKINEASDALAAARAKANSEIDAEVKGLVNNVHNSTGEAHEIFMELDSDLAQNSSVFGGQRLATGADITTLGSNIDTINATQQSVIYGASTNASAVKAAQSQAQGAANARSHSGSGSGTGKK